MRKGNKDKSYVDTFAYAAVNEQRKQVDRQGKAGRKKVPHFFTSPYKGLFN